MATIQNIVDRALEKAGVKDPSQDSTSEDRATAIDELNDMMLEWNADNLFVNYTMASDVDDADTSYAWAHGAMKNHLCLRICAEYQMPLPPYIVEKAPDQMRILRQRLYEDAPMQNLDTYPIGSGNWWGYGLTGRYGYGYFFDGENEYYLENGGQTLTNGKGQPATNGSPPDNYTSGTL